MGRRDDDYKFLQIIDGISSINQRVNLIGIVIETSIPKQSKGTDCFCVIKIVDESKSSPGIPVNFFAEAMEKLPQVQSAGDIIQLSRVVMKTHGSEVYAVYNKKFSSFALFEGKHGSFFIPYQFSSTYHARDQDKKLIVGLRKWLLEHPSEIGQVIGIHSTSELESKLKAATKTSRIAILYFTATWWEPCRHISPIYTSLAAQHPKLVFLKADIDEASDVAAQWNISSVPTFYFIKDGKQVDKVAGANKSSLERKIAQFAG